MAVTFDSAWDPLASLGDLTITKFNDIIADLQAWLPAIDDDFVVAGAFSADRIDGTAMTLDDPTTPGTQALTRDTRQTGYWHQDGEMWLEPTEEDCTDLSPDVAGVRLVRLTNGTASSQTITRFDSSSGLTEGQLLTVVLTGADDIVLTNTAFDSASTEGQITLDAGSNYTYTAASTDLDILQFIAIDNGTVVVWCQLTSAMTLT